MSQDVAEMVERYLSEDQAQWARLASDIQYRRLHLLLLREILLELRKQNRQALRQASAEG
ncbi:MAG: hypothetical protein QHJ81_09995 [Anaerolineae bacterium]|nr:hypothetical protein [Anaerolineae bacterium]